MAFEELSLEMAKRLRQARESKGLSLNELKKEIKDKYDIELSKDSLMYYEIDTPNHSRSYANNGMRIETLRLLADFYGVSTDYLLGLTPQEVKTPSIEDRAICEKTGLSSNAVTNLIGTHNYGKSIFLNTIDFLLKNENQWKFLAPEDGFLDKERSLLEVIADFLYSPIPQGLLMLSEDGKVTDISKNVTRDHNGFYYMPHGYMGIVQAHDLVDKVRIDRIARELVKARSEIHTACKMDVNEEDK